MECLLPVCNDRKTQLFHFNPNVLQKVLASCIHFLDKYHYQKILKKNQIVIKNFQSFFHVLRKVFFKHESIGTILVYTPICTYWAKNMPS